MKKHFYVKNSSIKKFILVACRTFMCIFIYEVLLLFSKIVIWMHNNKSTIYLCKHSTRNNSSVIYRFVIALVNIYKAQIQWHQAMHRWNGYLCSCKWIVSLIPKRSNLRSCFTLNLDSVFKFIKKWLWIYKVVRKIHNNFLSIYKH